MEFKKNGDQNVEFFKGYLILLCATKSAQPFKSNGHSKLGKGEKKMTTLEILSFYLIVSSSKHFFIFFLPSLVPRAVLGPHLAAWSGLFEQKMIFEW